MERPTKETCKLIQWKKLCTLDGKAVCPSCHEPAEEVLGIFGEPVYAHKITR